MNSEDYQRMLVNCLNRDSIKEFRKFIEMTERKSGGESDFSLSGYMHLMRYTMPGVKEDLKKSSRAWLFMYGLLPDEEEE